MQQKMKWKTGKEMRCRRRERGWEWRERTYRRDKVKRGGSKKEKQTARRKGNRVNKEGERSTGRVRGEERE